MDCSSWATVLMAWTLLFARNPARNLSARQQEKSRKTTDPRRIFARRNDHWEWRVAAAIFSHAEGDFSHRLRSALRDGVQMAASARHSQ